MKKRYSILISEDDPDIQFLYKVAIAEINPEIEIDLVFTGEQLVQYLLKDKLERALNRQNFPNLIIASLKEPFFLGEVSEGYPSIRAFLQHSGLYFYFRFF